MLKHGGKLVQASRDYKIPLSKWIDLSTGINPIPWPIKTVPMSVWARLPEDEDGLREVACQYYGSSAVLPTAGSQATIQVLPLLWTKAKARIGILSPSYSEHLYAWNQAGYDAKPLTSNQIEHAINKLDVLVLSNPNNPTGLCFNKNLLLDWHNSFVRRGGCLIIDEAFIDATSELSLAKEANQPGLIILRSLGKFFGLAGIRVGFTIAEPSLLKRLESLLGPWTITGPSRYVAKTVLQDTNWKNNTCRSLKIASQQLLNLLHKYGLKPSGGTPLFQWVKTPAALQIHQQLCKQGIFTRLFEDPSSLRFGLPANQRQWQRLELSLSKVSTVVSLAKTNFSEVSLS